MTGHGGWALLSGTARRGYVPVSVNGSAIKVGGALFEGAGKGYDGTRQYWLHGVFAGPLYVSGRLHPGGVGVTRGWREQLMDDVAPLLDGPAPVWVRADNAYYRRYFARYCRERGWDYSVSVTHGVYRGPILDVLAGLDETAWEDIGLGESAMRVRYRPGGRQTQDSLSQARPHLRTTRPDRLRPVRPGCRRPTQHGPARTVPDLVRPSRRPVNVRPETRRASGATGAEPHPKTTPTTLENRTAAWQHPPQNRTKLAHSSRRNRVLVRHHFLLENAVGNNHSDTTFPSVPCLRVFA